MSSKHLARISCSIVLILWLAWLDSAHAQARFESPRENVEHVIDLMVERLDLMRPVGLWKKHHGLPIQDAERERRVLDATVREAERLGIEPAGAHRLFELQIELARDIQERIVAANAPVGEPLRDLSSDLRPALDRIGKELLIALYLAMPELERPDFSTVYATLASRLAAAGIGESAARSVMDAVGALRRMPTPPISRSISPRSCHAQFM